MLDPRKSTIRKQIEKGKQIEEGSWLEKQA